ncbi:thioredoxin-like [Mantella aurantiaca]
MVRELSNLAAYHEALSSAGNKLVVIEFIGSWSPPCKIMEPKFEKYSQTYPDVLFFKVNVDDVKHELDAELRKAGQKLVVVTFSSQNCGPCRPVPACLEALCEEMPDVLFIKIEVGKCDEFTKQFSINGVPAFFFFRNGIKIYSFEGGNLGFFRKMVDELRFKTD